jgi:hypothetical protein
MIVVTSYKNVITVAMLSSLILLLTFIATPTHLAFAHHTTEGEAYWYNVCKSPIVDMAIMEDCRSLVSDHDPGGYGFSEEGWRVLKCLGGGALTLFGISRDQLEIAADSMGITCGGR